MNIFFNTEMMLKAMETWKIGTTNKKKQTKKQALSFKETFQPKIRHTIYALHQFSPYSSMDDPVTWDNSQNIVCTIFFDETGRTGHLVMDIRLYN